MKIEKTASPEQIANTINTISARLKGREMVEICSRCNGEGRVFFSSLQGGVCFDCQGKGARWNAPGRKRRALLKAGRKVIDYKVRTGHTDCAQLSAINDILRPYKR